MVREALPRAALLGLVLEAWGLFMSNVAGISPTLAAYLARIGLAGAPSVDGCGLAAMQAAHRQTIAFENLSVRLGDAVQCDSASAFAKLVTAQRGGFCFEHNQLLADMLGGAGFDCRLLLARVLLGNPATIPARTHCLLLAELADGPWIADAGFGGSYAPPMPLIDGALAQSGDGAHHRLTRMDDAGALARSFLLERKGPAGSTDGRGAGGGAWEPQYAFDLAPVLPSDLAMGCHWSATHPQSRFTKVTVASLCLPDGFASMVDRQFTSWRMEEAPARRDIADAAEYRELLEVRFGIALGAADIARLPLWD